MGAPNLEQGIDIFFNTPESMKRETLHASEECEKGLAAVI